MGRSRPIPPRSAIELVMSAQRKKFSKPVHPRSFSSADAPDTSSRCSSPRSALELLMPVDSPFQTPSLARSAALGQFQTSFSRVSSRRSFSTASATVSAEVPRTHRARPDAFHASSSSKYASSRHRCTPWSAAKCHNSSCLLRDRLKPVLPRSVPSEVISRGTAKPFQPNPDHSRPFQPL